ncbi:MAG: hypothetical protein GY696_14575 [Gammaproteobacteria bacterium]|nr:hypothetical protein [Gammaproteobacteria bacterium]
METKNEDERAEKEEGIWELIHGHREYLQGLESQLGDLEELMVAMQETMDEEKNRANEDRKRTQYLEDIETRRREDADLRREEKKRAMDRAKLTHPVAAKTIPNSASPDSSTDSPEEINSASQIQSQESQMDHRKSMEKSPSGAEYRVQSSHNSQLLEDMLWKARKAMAAHFNPDWLCSVSPPTTESLKSKNLSHEGSRNFLEDASIPVVTDSDNFLFVWEGPFVKKKRKSRKKRRGLKKRHRKSWPHTTRQQKSIKDHRI